jgi:hypothetical protein
MVTQDANVLGAIYQWSEVNAAPGVDNNSDVIASSDFIDNSVSAVNSLDDTSSLTGKYDPTGDTTNTNAQPVPEGYQGVVVGMLTDQYRDSISNEFIIYDDSEEEEPENNVLANFVKVKARAAARSTSSVLNFQYVQNDLTQDAGIIVKTKKTTTGTSAGGTGSSSKRKHRGTGEDAILNPELLFPPTGGSLAIIGVLLMGIIGLIGFLLTGKKKEKKGETGHEEEEEADK